MGDIRKLFPFLRPYGRLALFSLAMLLAMVALDLSIPRLVERLIDQGIKAKDMGLVLRTSALMLGVSFLNMAVAVLNSNSSIRVGEGVARDLREAVFVKIQGFSNASMDGFSTGKLMVRLTNDTGAVQRLTQVTLRIGTRAPLSMIGSIVLMFVTSPALAWSMVPLLFLAGLLIVLSSLRMKPQFRKVQARLDRLNTVLQENIAGARLVKAFVRADREAERFEAANEDLTQGTIKVMEFMSSMSPALTVLINAGIVLVVWLGGIQSISGTLSIGQIVAFTNYLLATMNPLIMMTQLSNTWANGLASAKRVNEVLDTAVEVRDPASPRELPAEGRGSVRFEHVDFRYDGGSSLIALEDICLEARPGQTIAILGATGSGKSTLVNLIPRFYDPTRGSVLVGGIDVRELAQEALHRIIAIVPQETILFTGSIRDNIRYGRPDASEEEVAEAAKAAEAHDFILRLRSGYDTHVEERGVNLSGGQKQRIAIARAILSRPSILILDDSTSAVDVETETRIQGALAALMRGCTCFIVAQRISTVLNADRIVVLDEGRIAAVGRHAELLATSGIYKEIYDSQLGGGFHE
jgi:ATP-binding cassette, subfamily B, multidrug efflux pump